MRNLLVLVLVIGIGVAVFMNRRGAASEGIRAQMLLIVQDMDLAVQESDDVKSLLAQFHERAFNRALDVSKQLGRKFDEKSYYHEVFSLTVDQLREAGGTFLADKIERLQAFHSLSVTEH